MIIYAWQMLEDIKTDVLGLQKKLSKTEDNRRINLGDIKEYRNGDRVFMRRIHTKLLNSPARKMERLFNCIPEHIRNITGSSTEYFKKKLDEWLKGVPDQPKCGAYAGRCVGRNNSIVVQRTMGNGWR